MSVIGHRRGGPPAGTEPFRGRPGSRRPLRRPSSRCSWQRCAASTGCSPAIMPGCSPGTAPSAEARPTRRATTPATSTGPSRPVPTTLMYATRSPTTSSSCGWCSTRRRVTPSEPAGRPNTSWRGRRRERSPPRQPRRQPHRRRGLGQGWTIDPRPSRPCPHGRRADALRTPPADGDAGDLAKAIRLVRKTAKRRSMVIVVSDFLGEPAWERSLRALTARHEVIAVQVNDRREFELLAVGLIAVIDPETGRRRLVDTADEGVRERYAALAAAGRTHSPPVSPQPASTTSCCAPTATGCSMSSASSASAGPGVAPPPLPPAPRQDLTMIALAFSPRSARAARLADRPRRGLPRGAGLATSLRAASPTLDLLDEVAPDRPGWRRHLPAVVLLAATVAATLAVARPAVARELSEPQRIVVLAVDTSLSMQATDVDPSRSTRQGRRRRLPRHGARRGRSAWSRSTRRLAS